MNEEIEKAPWETHPLRTKLPSNVLPFRKERVNKVKRPMAEKKKGEKNLEYIGGSSRRAVEFWK